MVCAWAFAVAANGLTLEEALARTAENSPEIRVAKLRLEEAAGQRLVLRATGLPDVRVNAPGGVQGGQRAGERSVQPFAFGQGALTQPLFSAALPATFRRASLEILIAQQRLHAAVLEQLHAARIAYFTASYQDSLHRLGEGQQTRLRANARTQNDRYQAGRIDRAAVASARVLEEETVPRLEAAQRARDGALLKLAELMGADLTGPLPAASGELQFAPVDFALAAETKIALQRRADLKLARLLVAAAREEEQIARAGYFPQIAATVSGTYIPISDIRRGAEGSARRSDDIVSSEARAGIAYSWRVIDNGQVTGAVVRQRALREANEAVLARLEADVPRELQRIQNNLRALQARHQSLNRASTAAAQTVRDIENHLEEGLSSQLEYRSAETNFLQTQAGLLTAAYEQQLALAARDRITGRYFEFSAGAGRVH